MSWNDATIIPSLLFSVSQFYTPLEVKLKFLFIKTRRRKIVIKKLFFGTCQYVVETLLSE